MNIELELVMISADQDSALTADARALASAKAAYFAFTRGGLDATDISHEATLGHTWIATTKRSLA